MSDSSQAQPTGSRQSLKVAVGASQEIVVPAARSLRVAEKTASLVPIGARMRSRPWLWVLTGMTTAGLLTAGFVNLLAKPAARFPLLVLIETGYRHPLPPNPWGAEDREYFRDVARQSAASIRVIEPSNPDQHSDPLSRLQSAWEAMEDEFDDRPEVVGIYLSFHGHVDPKGEPWLIPRGADLSDAKSWISVQTLLDAVETFRSSTPKPGWSDTGSSRVVLFLDAARAPVTADLNLTHRSFAGRVQQRFQERPYPGIQIILAAAEGQRSLCGRRWGGGLFVRSLQHGLSGEADVSAEISREHSKSSISSTGERDARVDLFELSQFLERTVSSSSWNDSGSAQRTVLVGHSPEADDNLQLTQVSTRRRFLGGPSLKDNRSFPEWPSDIVRNLNEAWQDLEQACRWNAGAPLQAADAVITPARLADLRARLLWIEAALDGGPSLQSVVGPMLEECRADLLRKREETNEAVRQEPAVTTGVDLAIDRLAPQSGVWSEPQRKDIQELRQLAEAADQAWGTSRSGNVSSLDSDRRVHELLLPHLRRLDDLRRPLEEELFVSLAHQGIQSNPRDDLNRTELEDRAANLRRSYGELGNLRDLLSRSRTASEAVLALGPLFARWNDATQGGINTATGRPLEQRFLDLWNEACRLRRTLGGPLDDRSVPEVEQLRVFLADLGSPGRTESGISASFWMDLTVAINQLVADDDSATSAEDLLVNKRKRCAALAALLQSGFPCDACGIGLRSQARTRWRTLLEEIGKGPASVPPPTDGDGFSTLRSQLQDVLTKTGSERDLDLQSRRRAMRWDAQSESIRQMDSHCAQELHRAKWQRLRSLSRRELGDFWPSAQGRAAGFARLQPVWDQLTRLARDPLATEGENSGATERAIENDRAELSAAESLVARRLQVQSSPLSLLPDGFSQEWTTQLEPQTPLPSGLHPVLGLSLWSGADGVWKELLVSSPPAGIPPTASSLTLPASKSTSPIVRLDYRGWRREYPVSLRSAEWTSSLWSLASRKQPTVQVRLGTGHREDVLLVLDCSASMESAVDRGDREGPSTRFEAAREALSALLEGLSGDDQMRVGIWLIGHRVAWSRRDPGRLLRQQDYSGGVPDDLRPAADVESILPLGRFDTAAWELVNRRLETVLPWGETPLYLALSRAVAELNREGKTSVRRIIAITDGLNYQFNPSAEVNVSLDRLKKSAWESRIGVNVIGFGLAAADRERADQQYDELVTATGGRYVRVEESAALLATLRGLLQPSTFTVRDERSRQEWSRPLGTPVALPLEQDAEHDISVRIPSQSSGMPADVIARTTLMGDEAVDLVLDPVAGSARSAVFEGRSPQLVGLRTSSGLTADLQLGVHVPKRSEHRIEFLFSLRSNAGEVVPRPDQIWMEITPVHRKASGVRVEAAGPVHVFQDVTYLPQTPNPVFQVACQNWPDQGTDCWIEVWIGPRPGNFSITEPDSEAASPVWTETIPAGGRPFHFVRLGDASGTDLAAVERVFVPDLGQVQHRFLFRRDVPSGVQLEVSDSKSWKESAISSFEPMRIPIPGPNENLRPQPQP
jgi:hypothetical protein